MPVHVICWELVSNSAPSSNGPPPISVQVTKSLETRYSRARAPEFALMCDSSAWMLKVTALLIVTLAVTASEHQLTAEPPPLAVHWISVPLPTVVTAFVAEAVGPAVVSSP